MTNLGYDIEAKTVKKKGKITSGEKTIFQPLDLASKKVVNRVNFDEFENWRRERDSNPRNLSAQRFSRPPHSTTLPSLREGF